MQGGMKGKTSEVIARKRELACFCRRQDRWRSTRLLQERSCFFPPPLQALQKLHAEMSTKFGTVEAVTPDGIGQNVWHRS